MCKMNLCHCWSTRRMSLKMQVTDLRTNDSVNIHCRAKVSILPSFHCSNFKRRQPDECDNKFDQNCKCKYDS